MAVLLRERAITCRASGSRRALESRRCARCRPAGSGVLCYWNGWPLCRPSVRRRSAASSKQAARRGPRAPDLPARGRRQPTRNPRAVQLPEASSQSAASRERARIRPADADPGRRHPPGHRRPRRARLRLHRQRQDRRLPAAHPAPADRAAARHHAGARAHAHARAGGPDPRRSERSRRAHAHHRRVRSSAVSAWGRRSTPSAAASTC